MSRVALILVRLFVVLVGYGVAALAASLFLHFIAWPAMAPVGQEAPWLLMGGLLVSIPLVALFASYFAFLPGALLIGLSELRGYRSWLYHALSGGIAAFAGIVLARMTRDLPGGQPPAPDAYGEVPLLWEPEVMAAAVAAGLVAGLAYWLIAGRFAGRWGKNPTRSV